MKEVLAVDLGSEAVKAVVGAYEEGRVVVRGFAQVPTKGALKAGAIMDMAKAAERISEAVREAARMAGARAELLDHAVGITGTQIHAKGCKGAVAIKPGKGITEADVARAKEQAKVSLRLPSNHEVIYLHPNYYTVEDKTRVSNPVGFVGRRLEIFGYVVTAERNYLDNLRNCLKETPVSEPVLFFQPIAASFGVLSEETRQEGAIVLDVGKSLTQVALWREGMLLHVDVFLGGCERLTSAVAAEFKMTRSVAQWLIENYGSVEAGVEERVLAFKDPNHGTRYEVRRDRLAEVLARALEEHLGNVYQALESAGIMGAVSPGTTLVLVGGAGKLPGADALAGEVFDLPSVVGVPKDVESFEQELSDPRFAVGVGLLKMAFQEEGKSLKSGFLRGFRGLWEKIKEVF